MGIRRKSGPRRDVFDETNIDASFDGSTAMVDKLVYRWTLPRSGDKAGCVG